MSVDLLDNPMTKPSSETMRVDAESARIIRKAAALKELSIMDFVREHLTPVARRILASEVRKLGKEGKAE